MFCRRNSPLQHYEFNNSELELLKCEYCGADFKFKGEVEIHIAHTHPEMMKQRGVDGYFQVLQNREKSGYYVRQIAYWKKRK